jgi:peptidoglycan/LPS O-acetylase OafA/YrhL
MVGPRSGNRPGLDGLRAVAVLAVLAPTPGRSRQAGSADLFFCLSGISSPACLAEGEHSGRIAPVEFWRCARHDPAVVLLLALSVVGWISVDGWTVRHAPTGRATYTSNWTHLAADHGYFEQFSAEPAEHMWSLAVEEQFYVVWLLLPAPRAVRRRRGCVAAPVAALTAAWQVLGLGTDARPGVSRHRHVRRPSACSGGGHRRSCGAPLRGPDSSPLLACWVVASVVL